MTRRFDQIVTNQISEQEILVESIPHLLHQDLAYLWILSLPAEQRPHVWRDRIQLWKDLAGLFFSGQLELERVPVERIPLGQLMADVGLNSIHWARLKQPVGSTRLNPIVGVTSSTVIIRPLPTFDSSTADLIREAARRRPDEASYFVRLALKALASVEGSTPETLSRILTDEFAVRLDANESRTQAGVDFRLPMLKEIDWCNQSTFEEVSFLTRSEGPRAWVPRCDSCNKPLAAGADQQPIVVGETDQTISVQCQSCKSRSTVDLQRLLVWQRSASQIVIWKPDNEVSPDRLPPEPSVHGIDVTWEWNAAVLGGEAIRRFLKLRFPGRSAIRVQDMDDIFFDTLLTCGPQSSFEGLPVRGEWFDALSAGSAKTCLWRDSIIECSFEVVGYPERVLRKYGAGSIQHSDELVVGVFPDPTLVPSAWAKFRAFIEDGSPTTRVEGSNSWNRMLPTVIEATQGLPQWFSIVEGTRGTTGVTFPLGKVASRPGVKTSLSLDFGTTNSLIYSSADQQITPGNSAIPFGDAHRATRWFGKADIAGRGLVGSFLPGPAYRADSPDRFNVPSAVWSSENVTFIRCHRKHRRQRSRRSADSSGIGASGARIAQS